MLVNRALFSLDLNIVSVEACLKYINKIYFICITRSADRGDVSEPNYVRGSPCKNQDRPSAEVQRQRLSESAKRPTAK